MDIPRAQHHHTLLVHEYLSDRPIRGHMRLEGGVSLELATVKGHGAALAACQTPAGTYTHVHALLSYIIVSGPQQLLCGIECHCRHGRGHGMDARRREGNAGDLATEKFVNKALTESRRVRKRAVWRVS